MINFFTEDVEFFYHGRDLTRLWLKQVAESENRSLKNVNIIFCSDPYILEINRKFLGHDYFTDIITFDYCTSGTLSGDLFISVETVKYNSEFYHTDFINELHRVIVHGILHLIGYNDLSDSDISVMRSKENQYLKQRPFKLYGQSL